MWCCPGMMVYGKNPSRLYLDPRRNSGRQLNGHTKQPRSKVAAKVAGVIE